MAVEDSVGELHVGVFDGAVFGLVGDDGAGNLDDCFVAVLAALFDGGFCAIKLGLLAVNEDDGLRLTLDGLLGSLGFVLVLGLPCDVAGLVHKNGLSGLSLAFNVLGGCHGCLGSCCGFEFRVGGDDGAAAELDVLDEVGEGNGGLGLVLGHDCLLICWVHVCFNALDVHIYLYSFKLPCFPEWCARFRHATDSACCSFLLLCCHVPCFFGGGDNTGYRRYSVATQAVSMQADWETPPYCRYTD